MNLETLQIVKMGQRDLVVSRLFSGDKFYGVYWDGTHFIGNTYDMVDGEPISDPPSDLGRHLRNGEHETAKNVLRNMGYSDS